MMYITIQSPPYDSSSGGIRALHYLGYLCYLLGHKVDMTTDVLNGEWGFYSRKNHKTELRILPEIYQPSQKDGINTIRWVLYYPAMLCGGAKEYPQHEFVVAYHHDYLAATEKAARKKCPVFFLPYINMPSLNDTDVIRVIEGAIWFGKGTIEVSKMPKFLLNLPVITRQWPKPRFELIRFLKSIKNFYSFDKNTMMNDEALMCGCKVFIWDNEKFIEYHNNNPEKNIMNISRDLVSVSQFLTGAVTFFDNQRFKR